MKRLQTALAIIAMAFLISVAAWLLYFKPATCAVLLLGWVVYATLPLVKRWIVGAIDSKSVVNIYNVDARGDSAKLEQRVINGLQVSG